LGEKGVLRPQNVSEKELPLPVVQGKENVQRGDGTGAARGLVGEPDTVRFGQGGGRTLKKFFSPGEE